MFTADPASLWCALKHAFPAPGKGDALSYVWIGPNKASVTSAGGSTTPSGGQLIKAAPATANRVYTNSNNGLTYSSPDIHTVPAADHNAAHVGVRVNVRVTVSVMCLVFARSSSHRH